MSSDRRVYNLSVSKYAEAEVTASSFFIPRGAVVARKHNLMQSRRICNMVTPRLNRSSFGNSRIAWCKIR